MRNPERGELVWSFCSSALWEKPYVNKTRMEVVVNSYVEPGEMFIVIDTIPDHSEIKVVNFAGKTGWICKDVLFRPQDPA